MRKKNGIGDADTERNLRENEVKWVQVYRSQENWNFEYSFVSFDKTNKGMERQNVWNSGEQNAKRTHKPFQKLGFSVPRKQREEEATDAMGTKLLKKRRLATRRFARERGGIDGNEMGVSSEVRPRDGGS